MWCCALLISAAVGSAGCLPVGSTLAIFTKQVTVTANTVSAAASFPICYRDAVLADNPVSYWQLDETSGTSAADSKGSNTGTYTNGPALGQSGALPDSVNNKAPGFDGTDDYVNVPYAAAFNGATFTVEGWARLTGGVANYPTVAGSYYESGSNLRGYWLGVGNNNRWWLQLSNGSGYTNIMGPAPISGAWTHVVGTYDGTVGRLYINGTLVASATGGYVVNPSTPFAIGAYQANGSWDGFFPGQLDDVAVYNTALTAAQIRTHYNTGRCYKDAVLADSPTAYWRLGESSGTTAIDGIRGRHGAYTNGPTLNQTGALNGDANPAASFDGVNDYVTVPYTSALNPSQFTIEAWAKPTGGAGTFRTVLSTFRTAGLGGFGIWAGSDDKWQAWVSHPSGGFTSVSAPLTLNSWAHLVATYDGTTLRLYVDGLLAGSAAGSYAPNTVLPLGIGAAEYDGSTWTDFFPGSIDDVALYPTALSSARIQAHYLLGRSYTDTVLDSGPVSYWRLGEAAGTSAADAKVSNTATYTNGPTLAQTGSLAGDADTAPSFDGVDDYVNAGNPASLQLSTGTIEAWFKTAGGGASWQDIINKQSAYNIALQNGVLSTWDNTAGVTRSTGVNLADNQWHHVAMTFQSGVANGTKIYADGVLQLTTTITVQAQTNAFHIGDEGGTHEYFLGTIDEVAVYNRVLSATEIQLHYDSGQQ